MQSPSIDKSDFQIHTIQESDTSQFIFRILFGEFCLLHKVFSGQIIKPNIFAENCCWNLKALISSDTADHAHVVSALSDENQRIGVTTIGERVVYTYRMYNRMFVDVSGDYDSYLSAFRKKSLNSLKRKIKKAENSNKNNAAILEFTRPEQVREFVELAKPISLLSYQEAKLGTVFRTDDEWIKKLETQARNNRFRGYVLYINDAPVAYNYCPVYDDGVLLYDLSGYIPESSQYSPGTVLQAHIIKQSFADESIKLYDLCEGEGRHKEQFATGSKSCFNAYIFPDTAYYRLLVFLHRTLEQLSNVIVNQLNRLGLKEKIKTYLRRRG